MTEYYNMNYGGKEVQVESAVRDEEGYSIKGCYAKKNEIKDGVLTINTNGGSTLGMFSANQSTNQTITLPDGSVQLLNQSVTFASDNTYEEFPYRATVNVSGVTASTYAEVTYSEEQATSLNFATFIETDTDTIYLYSRTNVGTVTIPTISIGMDYSDITIDATPTSGSGNAVSSGGTYTALNSGLQALYPVGSIYMNATNSTNPGTLLGFGTWQELAPGRVLMGAGNSSYEAGQEYGEYTHTLTTTEMPSHGHSVSVNGTNTDHYHGFTTGGMSANAWHGHNLRLYTGDGGAASAWRPDHGTSYGHYYQDGGVVESTNIDHTHSGATGGMSANASHGHTVNQSNAGGNGAHNNVQPSLVVYMWVRTA